MKGFLKRIFSHFFLKQAFLLVNTIKIKTVDRILFSTYSPASSEIILFEEKNPFLELNIDMDNFEPSVRDGFSRWMDPNWKQDQYIVEIRGKTISIEPKSGWGIIDKSKLVYFSLGFAKASYVLKPPLKELFFSNRTKIFIPKIISLRDTGEENYFHFFNDIIAKLLLLRDHQMLDPLATIVVSEKLWSKNYFQDFIKDSWLSKLNWFVQRGEWVQTNHVIFCKAFTHTATYLSELADLAKPIDSARSNKRVFVTRKSTSLRFIENEGEICSILSQYGFQNIDTSTLSLKDQMALFSDASDVIAIHGAGISNIIFRKGHALRLLEIFHINDYLPFHYIMLASIFGFNYQALRGTQGEKSGTGGFYLNPQKIQEYCRLNFSNT